MTDVMEDKPVQCIVGMKSARSNLELIPGDKYPLMQPLKEQDRIILFDGLETYIRALTGDDRKFSAILNRRELFDGVKVSVGGYEISWGENLTIADYTLYDSGKQYDVKLDDFKQFAKYCLVNTSGAARILNCSRQYINDLIGEDRLHVVRQDSRNKLFLKSEVMKCKWK